MCAKPESVIVDSLTALRKRPYTSPGSTCTSRVQRFILFMNKFGIIPTDNALYVINRLVCSLYTKLRIECMGGLGPSWRRNSVTHLSSPTRKSVLACNDHCSDVRSFQASLCARNALQSKTAVASPGRRRSARCSCSQRQRGTVDDKWLGPRGARKPNFIRAKSFAKTAEKPSVCQEQISQELAECVVREAVPVSFHSPGPSISWTEREGDEATGDD